MATPKTFTYHSYKNGVYQGDLTKWVISDFTYQQEINSAGSAVTITLGVPADNFGEGTVVDFNNQILVYVIDDQVPNGLLIFQGTIINYQPVFTDTDQEQVVLTVMGYGNSLNDYMIEAIEIVDVNQNSQNGNTKPIDNSSKSGITDMVYQSFTIGGGITKLSAVAFWMAALNPSDIGAQVSVNIYSSQSDCEAGTNSLGTVTAFLLSQTAQAYKFTFAAAINVTAGNVYYARVDMVSFNSGAVYYDSGAPYSGGSPKSGNYNGVATTTWTAFTGDFYFISYYNTGNTTVVFNNTDPSDILRKILDNYANQGGSLTYTAASIDSTGTLVSYTFNTNSLLEGIQKCADMAPVGWYWYIDQANNIVHFHKINTSPDYNFTFGKNIRALAVDKRLQDLVNIVYFIGGPTGGVNLYQKYVLQSSINQYGRHALRYTDTNVTLAATAQVIANAILTNRGQAELRIELEILDNGGDVNSALGFNIESIILGKMLSLRSLGPGSGGSLWDVAKWDVAKWDFDINDLSSIIVQITKVEYHPDYMHMSLSTVPPDVTKRTEYIYRQLTATQVISNPATPS